MEWVELSRHRRFAGDKMQKVGLFKTERLLYDLYCLEPGQGQQTHAHAGADKVYYVIEGAGQFTVGRESRELHADMAVLAPAGAEHGVTNPGPGPLVLLVVVTPPPQH